MKAFNTYTATALSPALEGLLEYDDRGQLRPLLAESWRQKDPLTYVYTLRPGVRFWNGAPLTADDVVFSLSQHLDKSVGSQLAYYYAAVKSIRATGPREVTIKLKQADPMFKYVPAFQAGYIVQADFWRRHKSNIGTPATLTMGTGPYRITRFTPGDGVTYKRNDKYWGAEPATKNVELRFLPETSTRELALRGGEIDGAFAVPVDQADRWARINGIDVKFARGLVTYFLGFDMSSPPWNDIHVRRAVAYAADKRGLVKALLRGHGRPASQLNAPEQWGELMPPDEAEAFYAELPDFQYDITRAREELGKSQFPNGFSATVSYPNTFPLLGKAALSLAGNLADIGIKLRVKEVTADQWLAHMYGHKNLGLTAMVFDAINPDPQNYPLTLLHSRNAIPQALNVANYKNPAFDRLLDEQAGLLAPDDRLKTLKNATRIVSGDLPYLPLWWEDKAMAISGDYTYTGDFSHWYSNQRWISRIVPKSASENG